MIKIAVCDDDMSIVKDITQLLAEGEISDIKITPFCSGEQLLESKTEHDIIILDMEMGELDGIETAQRLWQSDREFILIYLTAFKEKVCNAFEVGAFRYLLKPINTEKLLEAVGSAVERINRDSQLLINTPDEELHSVRLSQILYFEVVERRIVVRLKDREMISLRPISDYESELKNCGFYRTHRAYLVNLGHIERVLSDRVFLDNGEAVKLSRLKRSDFLECYHRYVRRKLR